MKTIIFNPRIYRIQKDGIYCLETCPFLVDMALPSGKTTKNPLKI